MKTLFSLSLVLGFIVLAACSTPTSTLAPSAYLENAVDWIYNNSVHRDSLNRNALLNQARTRAQNAKTAADTYDAIRWVISQLPSSGYNSFVPPDQATRNASGEFKAAGLNITPEGVVTKIWDGSPYESELQVGDHITSVDGQPLDNRFPYNDPEFHRTLDTTLLPPDGRITVVVERVGLHEPIAFSIGAGTAKGEPLPVAKRIEYDGAAFGYVELPTGANNREYAVHAQELIKQIDEQGACGWIVDLRNGYGGNVWGMTGAAGPFLNEGEIAKFQGPANSWSKAWTYREGVVREDDQVWFQTRNYKLAHAKPPLAILTSEMTIFAGQMIANALREQPNTRVFGTNARNTSYFIKHTELSDGAFVYVESGKTVQGNGQAYDQPFAPDEIIATDWTRFQYNDPVIQAAQNWLTERAECKGKA